MKKIYVRPELETVEIELNSLICTSITMNGGSDDNGNALIREMDSDFDLSDGSGFDFGSNDNDFGI
jgi:hypothetical protein